MTRAHTVTDADPLDKVNYNTAATIIESTAVLTKTYKLVDGKPTQETSANMAQGAAIVKAFNTVYELAAILKGLTTNQAMSWGVVKNAHPGQSIQVLSRKKYEEQGRPKNAVARTNEFFEWGASGGVMMLDFDFKDVAMSQDEIIQRLYSIMPELQESAFIWWCSSSSYIYNGDAQHSDLKGQRIYILVKDASDIERAGKVLFERLWLAGYGHFEISKAGSLLTRSIIDSSVWQPNRLDFISGANCIAPMQQKRPEPDIHDGAHLDTAIVLKDLTAAEQAQVAALKEKAKAKISPEANAVKNQFIETTARKNLNFQRISSPSKEQLDQARETVKRAQKYDVLASDFVIYLDDMTAVTVGEILSNPTKYNGKLTKDPLEPDYDGGRTVGRLYLLNGKPNLHSQAHGGKNYKLIDQTASDTYSLDEIKYSSDKTAAEILDQLNSEQDPFKCAQFADAYTLKTLPNIPYKESLKSVRAKLEGKLNGVMLDLILERAQSILDGNKARALKAIAIHDTKQHKHLVINDFDELNDLNYKGVILLKAPTGTGKTQKVGKPFADWCMGGNLPFLAIAHRTSLISELSNTLNTEHYKVEQETYRMASKMGIDPQGSINSLAVCINSLDSEAFSKFIRSVKYLFIDEVTQVLEAFNSDTSFVTSKEKTDARLRQLIAEAECVIVADANINQDTLTFIESCRPNERFNIVEIKPKNEGKIVYLHNDKESVIDKIVRDIKGLNKKVWLTCDSAERARDADKVINGNHDIDSFLITRNTTKSKAKKFLDNIDQESKKYQAIIASPTISSGVSVEHRDSSGITQPHFDYVAGIFTGHSVTSRDAYQMLGRVRYATELHLFIDQKFTPYIDAGTKKEAWQNLSGESGTALTDLIATIQANNELDKANFANHLYYLLEYYGFEIRRAEYSVNAAIEQELKEARKEIKEADKNGILNANPITEEVANKYRRSLDLTDAEVYELRAYDKRMQLNLPFDAVLTEQDLNINIAQVIRYNAVFGHHKAVRDKATDIALRDYTKQAGDIFKGIFKELNIKGGAIFSDSQARSVLKRIEPYQKYLAAIGFIPKSFAQKKETKTAVKRLKLLLEHFGIKTDGKRIDNPALRKKSDTLSILSIDKLHEVSENDGAKVYRIDGASIEAMEQLADRYAIKSKTIELKTVSDQQQDIEPSNESPYFAMIPSDAGFYAIDPDDDYWQTGTI